MNRTFVDNGYLFFMCGLFTLLPKKALNLKLLITPFDLRNVILKSYVNLYGNPLVPRRKQYFIWRPPDI